MSMVYSCVASPIISWQSTRSNTPPCPGMSAAKSFSPYARLIPAWQEQAAFTHDSRGHIAGGCVRNRKRLHPGVPLWRGPTCATNLLPEAKKPPKGATTDAKRPRTKACNCTGLAAKPTKWATGDGGVFHTPGELRRSFPAYRSTQSRKLSASGSKGGDCGTSHRTFQLAAHTAT